MVTASHNPSDYTGMKIVRRGALPVGSESGLYDVRDRAVARRRGATRRAARSRPRTSGTGFVDRVLSFVDVEAIAPVRVVIDAANGMAGAMLPPVLERLPQVDAVRCYFEPDGSFPNHEPNPLLPENREFIVAHDDARRAPTSGSPTTATPTAASSSTTRGEFVPGDFTTALFAESILAKEPGGKVIYDVRASWAVPEAILRRRRRAAREPRRARVHQAADARRGRGLRRRGLGALLLPRLHAGRLRRDPVPAHARARLGARAEAERDPGAVPLALLPHRRDQHAGRRRRASSCRS